MSHLLVDAVLSGNHHPTQNQNRPPIKGILKGFSSLAPASRSTSPGSSSATPQNRAVSDKKTLGECVRRVELNDLPSSSAASSTSQLVAEIDGSLLDWPSMFKQARQNDAPEFPFLSPAAGFDNSLRVLSAQQMDNTRSIPGMDGDGNPFPGWSSEESVAAVLQRFGYDEDELKKLGLCSLKQVNPSVLHQIFIEKEKRAAGMSSKPRPKLRSILKPSKGNNSGCTEVEKRRSDSSCRSADGLPLDKESKHALDSNRTSLAKPACGPSKRLEAKPVHKVSPLLTSKKSKVGEAQRKQTMVKPQKLKQQMKQKREADRQTQPKLDKSQQNKQVKKTQKGLKRQHCSSKASVSKQPDVQETVPRKRPDVQGTVFEAGQKLTLSMIEDYEGAPPRSFPHQCSLCLQFIQDLKNWISHQKDENHVKNLRLFRIQFPEWIDGQPPPRKKLKKKAAQSLKPPQRKKNKPETIDGCQADESGAGSLSNAVRRSHPHLGSSGSHGESKGKPRRFRQTDPSHRENPDTEAPVCPQAKYTPESAAEVLQMFGLDKEDLIELDSYPEDQITSENLHVVLRQIFLRKKKRAAAAENAPESQTLTNTFDRTEGPGTSLDEKRLKPVKVIDYGHSSNHTIGLDAAKTTRADNREGKPKQKDTQPLKDVPQTSASKIRKSTLTGGCPSGPSNKTPWKLQAAAAVKKSKLQEEQKLKTKVKEIKAESNIGRASSRNVSPARPTPINPAAVRLPNHLPTLDMIKDYAAATPRTFPHTCSLCTKECFYMQDWLLHQNTSFHLESCRILRTQFPKWDGDVLPILSAEVRSSRSYSPAALRSSSRRWSKSRSRSRSNSHHRGGSKERSERSVSRSRSPYSRRYSQRSRSRSWSPCGERPPSCICRSHSRSHERRSSSGRKEERLFSPRRSCERTSLPRRSDETQRSQKLSYERRLSKESSGHRSEKARSSGKTQPETSAEVSRGKNKTYRTSPVYYVQDY